MAGRGQVGPLPATAALGRLAGRGTGLSLASVGARSRQTWPHLRGRQGAAQCGCGVRTRPGRRFFAGIKGSYSTGRGACWAPTHKGVKAEPYDRAGEDPPSRAPRKRTQSATAPDSQRAPGVGGGGGRARAGAPSGALTSSGRADVRGAALRPQPARPHLACAAPGAPGAAVRAPTAPAPPRERPSRGGRRAAVVPGARPQAARPKPALVRADPRLAGCRTGPRAVGLRE